MCHQSAQNCKHETNIYNSIPHSKIFGFYVIFKMLRFPSKRILSIVSRVQYKKGRLLKGTDFKRALTTDVKKSTSSNIVNAGAQNLVSGMRRPTAENNGTLIYLYLTEDNVPIDQNPSLKSGICTFLHPLLCIAQGPKC